MKVQRWMPRRLCRLYIIYSLHSLLEMVSWAIITSTGVEAGKVFGVRIFYLNFLRLAWKILCGELLPYQFSAAVGCSLSALTNSKTLSLSFFWRSKKTFGGALATPARTPLILRKKLFIQDCGGKFTCVHGVNKTKKNNSLTINNTPGCTGVLN